MDFKDLQNEKKDEKSNGEFHRFHAAETLGVKLGFGIGGPQLPQHGGAAQEGQLQQGRLQPQLGT